MNNKYDYSKFKKLARVFKVVMRVFFWGAIVTAVLSVIAGLVISFVPDTYFMVTGDGGTGFVLDGMDGVIRLQIITQGKGPVNIKPIVYVILVMTAVTSVLLSVIIRQLYYILGTVQEDKPFAEENVKRISTIGAALIMGAVVERIAEASVASAIINTFDIPNITVNYSIDGTMILAGFLVLILAGVFKYGNYLQKEYDATL